MTPLPLLAAATLLLGAAQGSVVLHGTKLPIAPATAEDMRGALAACEGITSADWLDMGKLRGELGWKDLLPEPRNRARPVTGVLQKPGNPTLIAISGAELKSKQCVVVARIDDPNRYHPTAEALSKAIGMPKSREGNMYTWQNGPVTIRMVPAGSREAPNIEFAVTSSVSRKDKG
ncbi:hypothetical protein [Sphingomonas sp.]|uniref:hypothetical protein n=1 Tax=Sphingomonas sp. TaxID=28214 RepID=UPI001EC75B28|nr:hypothetical protein [Sphingomonas sp.]MBX3593241.1 hypothetical protein [Sphingomonas sp.]